ncbi:MAG: tRNA epoxyqueuosine(34) reductase QueG [Planctomycetota bacterium]
MTATALSREAVVERCERAGFALAGVTPLLPSERGAHLDAWLRAGKHGSMGYLEEHAELRKDAGLVLEGARSVIVVGDQYAARGAEGDRLPAGLGRIAKYARGRDYHKVIKKRLHALCDGLQREHPDASFRAFVDTAPVMEREHALKAGLGWVGKHTLIINNRLGSYVLLGGILTTLAFDPPARVQADRCGTCTRCIDACPTGAITPYEVDARRCVSYLTIERRGRIDPAFHGGIGDRIFGCDVCQDVCPHNDPARNRLPAGEAHPAYEERTRGFDLLEVLGWTEEDRREAFVGSSMKRATLSMMRRNALIALGNAGVHRDRIEACLDDGDELVRTTARDVLDRLDRG